MHHKTPFSSSKLPPELCDIIIDHLESDWTSLSVCALVCKSWLPRSRSLLFPESFTFKLRRSNIHKFRTSLESPYASITPFIRRIAVFSPWIKDTVLFDELEHVVLHLVPRLNGISFTAYPDQILRKPQLIRCLSRTITSFSLRCDSGSVDEGLDGREILQLLKPFSERLENLELELDTLGIWLAQPIQAYALFPHMHLKHLRRLRLSVPWNSILPWFLVPNFMELPVLSVLVVDIGNTQTRAGSYHLLQAFLDRLCSRTVEEMEFRFYYGSLPPIDLRNFGLLRSLVLKGWHYDDMGIENGRRRVNDMLASVPKERKVHVYVKDEVKVIIRRKH
ncbi:hypothetical protein WG66_007875 [Moniliophthora roreri]|uniref:F-box domain-containing protein n=1 Tax=Moniliophthora roreri TaxID=221103 RepID=A0A0W0G2A8_MONRR|nr:hypothetical protein WG66_007875 [Moniliophthora roreri]